MDFFDDLSSFAKSNFDRKFFTENASKTVIKKLLILSESVSHQNFFSSFFDNFDQSIPILMRMRRCLVRDEVVEYFLETANDWQMFRAYFFEQSPSPFYFVSVEMANASRRDKIFLCFANSPSLIKKIASALSSSGEWPIVKQREGERRDRRGELGGEANARGSSDSIPRSPSWIQSVVLHEESGEMGEKREEESGEGRRLDEGEVQCDFLMCLQPLASLLEFVNSTFPFFFDVHQKFMRVVRTFEAAKSQFIARKFYEKTAFLLSDAAKLALAEGEKLLNEEQDVRREKDEREQRMGEEREGKDEREEGRSEEREEREERRRYNEKKRKLLTILEYLETIVENESSKKGMKKSGHERREAITQQRESWGEILIAPRKRQTIFDAFKETESGEEGRDRKGERNEGEEGTRDLYGDMVERNVESAKEEFLMYSRECERMRTMLKSSQQQMEANDIRTRRQIEHLKKVYQEDKNLMQERYGEEKKNLENSIKFLKYQICELRTEKGRLQENIKDINSLWKKNFERRHQILDIKKKLYETHEEEIHQNFTQMQKYIKNNNMMRTHDCVVDRKLEKFAATVKDQFSAIEESIKLLLSQSSQKNRATANMSPISPLSPLPEKMLLHSPSPPLSPVISPFISPSAVSPMINKYPRVDSNERGRGEGSRGREERRERGEGSRGREDSREREEEGEKRQKEPQNAPRFGRETLLNYVPTPSRSSEYVASSPEPFFPSSGQALDNLEGQERRGERGERGETPPLSPQWEELIAEIALAQQCGGEEFPDSKENNSAMRDYVERITQREVREEYGERGEIREVRDIGERREQEVSGERAEIEEVGEIGEMGERGEIGGWSNGGSSSDWSPLIQRRQRTRLIPKKKRKSLATFSFSEEDPSSPVVIAVTTPQKAQFLSALHDLNLEAQK